MAGHSKWANIKHRKAGQDAKRAKIFTKIIRELVVAAKEGGGEPNDNPRLRTVMDKALAANMTKDTIQRAINRGAGGQDGDDYEELVYEGYAAGGVAVLVEAMTDNRNRTVAEVRHAFSKYGGNLGTDGSVAYLFEKKGQLFFDADVDEEQLMEVALEGGAEDVMAVPGEGFEVLSAPEDYQALKDALDAAGLKAFESGITRVPANQVELDVEGAAKVLKLIDVLEDLDDVQNVYSNADISADVMEQVDNL